MGFWFEFVQFKEAEVSRLPGLGPVSFSIFALWVPGLSSKISVGSLFHFLEFLSPLPRQQVAKKIGK